MIKAYSNYAVRYDDEGFGYPVDLFFEDEDDDNFRLRTTFFIDEFFFLGNSHVRHIDHGGNYDKQVYEMVYTPNFKGALV